MKSSEKKKLKIALLGTRGVPANYGGFETCVEEVGQRLVLKGHDVTVYCRKGYGESKLNNFKGMRLVFLPSIKKRSLETLSHSTFSIWHSLFGNFDIFMVFNAANSILTLPLRIFGKKIAINTDGLEWKRSKWNFLGRSYYRLSEKFACLFANRLVSDSKGIHGYYQKKFGVDSSQIAYGAYIQKPKQVNKIREMGLEKGSYFLQITRFEPENHPLLTIEAFLQLTTKKKLVLVGGNPYGTKYTEQIAALASASDKVILPGSIYEPELLLELWGNCYAYIHGNSAGGTNPALLTSMAYNCFILSFDISFNRDVLQDCGIFYTRHVESLISKMSWALENKNHLLRFKNKATKRIQDRYLWGHVAHQYEQLFYDLSENRYPWHINWNLFL
jgi:glycosyltransferase involved in cell wall biosynthesis